MIALVPAAGAGSGMQSDCLKQYLPLHGEPLIAHTLRALARESRIGMLVVVVSPEDVYWEKYDWLEWRGRLRVLRCTASAAAINRDHAWSSEGIRPTRDLSAPDLKAKPVITRHRCSIQCR